MRRLTLVLMLVLPVTVMAQESAPIALETRSRAVSLQPEAVMPPVEDGAVLAAPGPSARVEPLLPPLYPSQQTAGQGQTARPAAPQTRRPRPEGSMVGYIDNAMVGSHLRLRFDDGFDNPFPDRAEFFYAKCSCYQGLATIAPPAFDPNASGPGLGVPVTVNFQQLYFDAEYAPHSRFSFFVELPVRWLQPDGFKPVPPFPGFSNQSGVSDLRFGFKGALVASEDRDLTFQFHVFTPTGDASKGMGTDHASVQPAVLYHQKVSQRGAIESQLGIWLPIGGNAGVPTTGPDKFSGKVFFYGIGPSYELYSSSRIRFAPVVELVGWHVVNGGQTEPENGGFRDSSGMNIVNIKFGARTSIDNRSSFYVGYGRALTDSTWYKDIVRIEYRYSF